MDYRNLGKSGLKVSEIGLGCVNFGDRIDEQQSIDVIKHAIDLGVNFLDTANSYGDGISETCVGKAVKTRRSEVIIATKFGTPTGNSPNDGGGSRYNILKAVEASLKRLGTDYIDLYYIHWPDPATPIEETLRTLDSLVKSGKVRYTGCCNFAGWRLCDSLWTSKTNNLETFSVVQVRYNILARGVEDELIPCCQKYGTGVVPWEPLAGGFLTGKYQRGKPLPEGARLSQKERSILLKNRRPPPLPVGFKMTPIISDTNYDKLEKLQKFSADHGHSVGELAIAWLLAHPYLTSVIAGATNSKQVDDLIKAVNWKLSVQEMTEIEKLISDALV